MVETIIPGIQVIGLYGEICPQAALEHLNLLKASITDDYIDCFDGEDIDPNRWTAGDWEMERVMYRQSNIVVEQGVCRIILDYEAN